MELPKPSIIVGGTHTDERGAISFVNGFGMEEVKRLYHIHHLRTNTIRAWQGHKREQKWFYVLEGSFNIQLVTPDDWTDPSNDLEVIDYKLDALTNVLHVPGGYANGFKAATENSKMIIFSDFSVDESNNDNYRFHQDLWVDWSKL